MQVKVRHALVHWSHARNGRPVGEHAFRGQIVDIPDEEAKRLLSLKAVVHVEDELSMPGHMGSLPETATDEEIMAWVLAATDSEVNACIQERPMLEARLLAALAVRHERQDAQNALLGGVITSTAPAAGEPEVQTEPPTPVGESTYDYATLIAGNVDGISAFLAEHPESYQSVLDAEATAAQQQQRQPRVGVVAAVQAAAGHVGQ